MHLALQGHLTSVRGVVVVVVVTVLLTSPFLQGCVFTSHRLTDVDEVEGEDSAVSNHLI